MEDSNQKKPKGKKVKVNTLSDGTKFKTVKNDDGSESLVIEGTLDQGKLRPIGKWAMAEMKPGQTVMVNGVLEVKRTATGYETSGKGRRR